MTTGHALDPVVELEIKGFLNQGNTCSLEAVCALESWIGSGPLSQVEITRHEVQGLTTKILTSR